MTVLDDAAAAVHALAAALRAAANDPADGVRLLAALAGASNGDVRRTGPTGTLCRRAAVIELCRACAEYRPTSYDDAAGLRALRAAVVQDLTARGATLAPLVTVERRRSLPALALAQDLYGDAARADELVERADPAHPLFMPPSFEAPAR